MKEKINWAILAPGIIANSMANAMSGTKGKVHTYAVGSRDLKKAGEFASKWGFEKAYGSYEELLKDKEVDAVYIANPHAFHYDSVIKCLNAGKHVLCEKPAGCNLDQLNTMIKTAREKNLFFMEAMWTAFNPTVAKIREWIKEGKIGELQHIESRFCNRLTFEPQGRMWNPDLAGGALLDLGIYNIYYAMLMNDFSPVVFHSSSVKMFNNVDAWNSVTLTFENGVTTSFQSACDRSAGTETHNAVVFGTKGFITTENFFMAQKAELHTFKKEWGNDNEITEVADLPFGINGYEYELIHANECILNGKIESEVHTHNKSVELCRIMDLLRKDWNFKYPFEK